MHRSEELFHCPSCDGNLISFLKCTDYLVSREIFTIQKCTQCELLVTSPRPPESEIGLYYKSENYISHTNSKAGSFNRIYQAVRKWNINQKLRLIKFYAGGPQTLLDFGCGTGEFLAEASQRGWKTTGSEPNERAREQAINQHKLEVVNQEQLFIDTKTFHVITLWHTLEHIHTLNETLSNLTKKLNENGLMFIAVPNSASFDAKHYRENWAAFDVPRHLYHFNYQSAALFFKKHGMNLLSCKPMRMDAFYVAMLSEKHIGKKIWFLRGLYNGLRTNLHPARRASSLIFILKKSGQ